VSFGVSIKELHVTLEGRSILRDVSARIESGVMNAMIGPNGAGKTTLVHAILGMTSYHGAIQFGDGSSRPRIGYVPQRAQIEPGAPLTVADLLASGLTGRPVFSGVSQSIIGRIESILDEVAIGDRIDRRLDALSGGEFQRVLLAQALLHEPELLILDEPNTGMDIVGHQLFCGLVDRIHAKRGVTTLLVTHDLGVVADHAHRVIGLHHTVLFEGDVPSTLSEENLKALFGPHMSGLHGVHHKHASGREAQ
jgi:zinc transport system ATP-binding protein